MKTLRLSVVVAASLVGIGFIGCGGGNTDGGTQSFDDQIFVGNDSTVGRVELTVGSPSVSVGGTTTFNASALDSTGAPIRGLRMVCESEGGVRILEPVVAGTPPRSFQMTNANGSVDGIIGCQDAGTYQFGCRMAVGGNRRKFVEVRCTGERPNGFGGFVGSAGGNLGGGSTNPNSQNANIRITGIRFTPLNSGGTSSNSNQVDVVRGSCITCSDLSQQLESFSDDYVTLTVKSSSSTRVSLTGVRYEVAGIGKSEILPVTAELSASSGGGDSETTLSVLVFRAAPPFKEFIIGSGREISDDTGFKGVTFTVFGETALGKQVSASGSTTLAFQDYNYCPSGTVPNEALCPQG